VSRRFLIVRLGSMGDVIHGVPVAAALRAAWHDARIDWLVDPRYVELLNLVPVVDRRIAVNPRGPRVALIAGIRELRRAGYDAVFDLQGLIKSAVLARLAGGAQTIGLTRAHLREWPARLFYTRAVDPGSLRHVILKSLAQLAAVGIDTPRVEFPFEIPETPVARDVASTFGGSGYVAINPGAAWPNKRWPPARFGAIAAAIRDRFGLRSLVLWGPGERPMAEEVAAASQTAADISPPTTLTDVFAVLKGARLLVSGDTGPLHIACALGTPAVALFGPTWPERNGPWSPADVTVSRAEACICHHERRCRRERPCIDEIAVGEVFEAVERRMVSRG
jgi:lipopolysaccharide heptosyltransferase I